MKKYSILLLFIINFAFVFHQGKIELSLGIEILAQSAGNENDDNSNDDNSNDDTNQSPEIGDEKTFTIDGNEFTMEFIGSIDGDKSWVYTDDLGQEFIYIDSNGDGIPDFMWYAVYPDPTDPTTTTEPPTPPDPCSEAGADPCECNGDCPPPADPDPDDPLPKDCAGVEGGTAFYDDCQECVGGNTGKTECICEGDKCPICGGLVILEDENNVGLMKVNGTAKTCKKCTCLKKYTKADECKAWGQMYNNAITQKNEYCSIITTKNIYTWKTENAKEGVWSGPFNPKWDSNQNHWYLLDVNGSKEYIIGELHVHWDPFDENFSGPEPFSDSRGDVGVAEKLYGVPLLLLNAIGDVKYCWSTDGVHFYQDKLPYKVSSLINCSKSLINFLEGK